MKKKGKSMRVGMKEREGKCSWWLTVWKVEGKEGKNLVHLNLRGKGESLNS